MTDAPNAIVSCVTTKCISLKKAVIIASVSDLTGSLFFAFFDGKVAETIIELASFESDVSLLGLSAAMLSVVIWAVSAWAFGIPTSESHALISALTGAGIALNSGIEMINPVVWKKIIFGLVISVFLGFLGGYLISKITFVLFKKENKDKIFTHSQIISSALMSFMHGAQDSQKFTGILMLIFTAAGQFDKDNVPLWLFLLSPLFIAAGTASGGEKIIRSVGSEMIKMEKDQGFSSDIAGAVCLLLSTLMGMPVSTTHTKTSAVLGAGVAKSIRSVNLKVAGDIVIAWIVTFPSCLLLGWFIAKLFLLLA